MGLIKCEWGPGVGVGGVEAEVWARYIPKATASLYGQGGEGNLFTAHV